MLLPAICRTRDTTQPCVDGLPQSASAGTTRPHDCRHPAWHRAARAARASHPAGRRAASVPAPQHHPGRQGPAEAAQHNLRAGSAAASCARVQKGCTAADAASGAGAGAGATGAGAAGVRTAAATTGINTADSLRS